VAVILLLLLLLYDSAKKKAAKLNVGLESWFGSIGYGFGVWVWISMVAGRSFCYILANQIHQNPYISATFVSGLPRKLSCQAPGLF